MPITLRRACPEDADAICEVHRHSILDRDDGLYPFELLLAWAGSLDPEVLRMALSRDLVGCFVAEEEGRIAGFAVLCEDTVRAVYVHPVSMGRGLGRMLLKAAEDEARRLQRRGLCVLAAIDSRGFYERNGFRYAAEEDIQVSEELSMRLVRMTKDL